jgi:hypothetical protein
VSGAFTFGVGTAELRLARRTVAPRSLDS